MTFHKALSRAGAAAHWPLSWALFALALSCSGPRGRRAARRGATCAAVSTALHLPIKRLVGRPRPRGAGTMGIGPLTTSFPSGHTASDLSFTLAAAQELPPLLIPLSLATVLSHWSLVRGRKHYTTDVLAGGAIAFAVTTAAWKLRPPADNAA